MSEAIEAAAKWWADVISNPKFDALGGERDSNMEIGQVMATLINRRGPAIDTEAFRVALVARLKAAPAHERRCVDVDYGPDRILADAARDAGITDPSFTFPWKTTMWIDDDRVRVRYGYGAEVKTIYPEAASV